MRRHRRHGVALILSVAGLGLGGCGPAASAPQLRPRAATAPGGTASSAAPRRRPAPLASAPSALAVAEATHEYPSPPVRESVAAATPDAAGAVRLFAQAYVNWTASTVADDMRALAALSVGQARSAVQLAAARTSADGELRRAGIANEGTVEAIAPLAGAPQAGAPQAGAPQAGASRRYVVVTRETTTAARDAAYSGIGAVWHVTVATVSPLDGGGWAVSGWQPES